MVLLITQFTIKGLEIDSMRLIPSHPTVDDNIKLVVYSSDGAGNCSVIASAKSILGGVIDIKAKYFEGGFFPTMMCYGIDTLVIGKICPGDYSLLYKTYGRRERVTRWNPYASVYDTIYEDTDTLSFVVPSIQGLYPVDLPGTISLCEENVILDAGYYSGINYLWNTGETAQVINPKESGLYLVKLYRNTCEASSDSTIITSDCELYFPNSFTPNGDGRNDIFSVKGIDVKEFEITIYNRWGEKISSAMNMGRCWDGKLGDDDAPQGVYIWHASYITNDNSSQRINKSGHVNLLR